jgi:formate hydrogenlyase subunit 4
MTLALSLGTIIIGSVLVALYGIIAGLLIMGVDRKLAARMQARIGPPLTQPFTDLRKLLVKQSIVPENAIPWLFNAAPLLALASSLVILLYLPIGPLAPVLGQYGDLVLVMYLLTVPALAMVAGGFSSGSPYATVGAQREMVTMISYEFPFAVAIIGVAWRLAAAGAGLPFSLLTLTAIPIWSVVGPFGFVGALCLLVLVMLVIPGEVSRIPFDTPEAETELAGGLLLEYSGRNLAMFTLSLGVKTIVMGSLAVAMFLPWNLSPLLGLTGAVALVVDLAFFALKVFAVLFLAVILLRIGVARFRINQVVSGYWVYLGTLGIFGLIMLIADAGIAAVSGVA